MGEIFVVRNISHILGGNDHLTVTVPRINAYGLKAIRYTAHKLWQSLQLEIKESHTLTDFKKKIKKQEFRKNSHFVQSLGLNLGLGPGLCPH